MKAEEAILLYCLVKRKNKIDKIRKRYLRAHPKIDSSMEKDCFHALFHDIIKCDSKVARAHNTRHNISIDIVPLLIA